MIINQYIYIIIAFTMLSSIPIAAQQSFDSTNSTKGDVENFYYTGCNVFTSPLNFNKNDWITTGAIVGGTAVLFLIDKSVQNIALNNQTNINDKIFNIDKYYGNGYTAVFTTALYGTGLILDIPKIRKLGLQTTEAFILSGLVTGMLKILIGRRRPYAGESNLVFKPFQFNNDYQALPSGHSTVAFAVSTVMANYLDNIIWKSFWYGAAGFVALSRIYNNQHWISDVFLASAIGYFVGDFIVNINKKDGSNSSSVKLEPYFFNNRVGIAVSF